MHSVHRSIFAALIVVLGIFAQNNVASAQIFAGRIEFAVKLLPYTGNDDWIEGALVNLKNCLMSNDIPDQPNNCEFCGYALARALKQA